MLEQKIKKVIEEICPNCLPEYKYALLNNERYFSTFGINTNQRLNHFLCQVIHEAQYLTRTHENLNYSFDRLLQVWPKKFQNADPSWFHRKPEAIANFVYYKRMGNTEPGDGWKYRGRGLFQITGKWMYSKIYEMMKHLDNVPNFVEDPDATLDKRYILGVACCVWNILKCNNYVDKDDIKGLTKKINGGYNGLEDRIKLYKRIKMMNELITSSDKLIGKTISGIKFLNKDENKFAITFDDSSFCIFESIVDERLGIFNKIELNEYYTKQDAEELKISFDEED